MARFRWEPNDTGAGRYRDTKTGRFVSAHRVRDALDRTLDGADDVTGVLADALKERSINLAEWQVRMSQHVKATHLNAVALERGGWANMTPADYGRAGQIIREQYAYLRRFVDDIATGRQRLDGSLNVRARMYTQAGRKTFHKSRHASLRDGPVTHVRSRLHPADHCEECVALDGKWFKIGDPRYKLPGDRICRVNCHCTEEYGVLSGGEVIAV